MDKKRTSAWVWIVVVIIGGPLFYLASFGPACWVAGNTGVGANVVRVCYLPFFKRVVPSGALNEPPDSVAEAIRWYAALGIRSGKCLWIELDDTFMPFGDWRSNPSPPEPE